MKDTYREYPVLTPDGRNIKIVDLTGLTESQETKVKEKRVSVDVVFMKNNQFLPHPAFQEMETHLPTENTYYTDMPIPD